MRREAEHGLELEQSGIGTKAGVVHQVAHLALFDQARHDFGHQHVHHAVIVAQADQPVDRDEIAIQAKVAITHQFACRIEHANIGEVFLVLKERHFFPVDGIHWPALAHFQRVVNLINLVDIAVAVYLDHLVALLPGFSREHDRRVVMQRRHVLIAVGKSGQIEQRGAQ